MGKEARVYNYQTERSRLFTDEGQRMFLKIRDNVYHLLDKAGAVRSTEAIRGVTGDSWQMLACLDRLVELGEIVQLTNPLGCRGQDQVYIQIKKNA